MVFSLCIYYIQYLELEENRFEDPYALRFDGLVLAYYNPTVKCDA